MHIIALDGADDGEISLDFPQLQCFLWLIRGIRELTVTFSRTSGSKERSGGGWAPSSKYPKRDLI